MEPLVSIGLLTYNHEAYIEDCIAGLLQQDYVNIELIILDDASTDRTRERIDTFYERIKERFRNITLIYHKENCGNIPHNVNELVMHAKGEYYRHFAGDDIMCSNCISSLVNCMQMHPEVSVVYSNGYIINDSFKLGDREKKQKILPQKSFNDTCENTFRKLMFGNGIPSPTAMFRKSVFEKYGPYDETIPYEDYEYWLRISRREQFFYLDKDLVYYRKSENSMTDYWGKAGKNRVKKSMLSDQMTIQKYMCYLSAEDRKRAIALYYQRYYQLSYATNFYRGFFATAYKIRKLGIDFNLDFWNMFRRMIVCTLDAKLALTASNEWRQMSDKHLALLQLFNQWMIVNKPGSSVAGYLEEKGYSKVIIYGMGYAGQRLYDELRESQIEIIAVMDRNASTIEAAVPVLLPEAAVPNADCIVVTAISYFTEIKDMLSHRVQCPILSLENILYGFS